VGDRLSKFAQFISLTHPCTTKSAATAFIESIYKLYGMPWVIVSDRDSDSQVISGRNFGHCRV